MLNQGLQMNDLQTEFPAYPKLILLIEKIEEAKIIRYSIPYCIYYFLQKTNLFAYKL